MDVVIEFKAGNTRELGANYPVPKVTYPTDYGYIRGYRGEDGEALDVFDGKFDDGLFGLFHVWRPDVPGNLETKTCIRCNSSQLRAIAAVFDPVIIGSFRIFLAEAEWRSEICRMATE